MCLVYGHRDFPVTANSDFDWECPGQQRRSEAFSLLSAVAAVNDDQSKVTNLGSKWPTPPQPRKI
jgi:hypothetical protein